jgi:chaperonin GroES
MKLKPVHDKIVVRPIEKKEDEVTSSGIILPDTVDQGKLLEGEVIAAGNVIYSTTGDSIPIVVEKGDRILYSKHTQSSEYTLNGETVLIMSQNEVLSILEHDEN